MVGQGTVRVVPLGSQPGRESSVTELSYMAEGSPRSLSLWLMGYHL